jgi:glycosyltransferase involved in cell wall biosynthesis
MKETLLAADCPPEKLHVIPCGAPVDLFTPSQQVASQPCKFIAVSRLVPGKGPFVTLAAFAETRRVIGDTTLTWIGDGALRGAVSDHCKANGLDKSVAFVGAAGTDEVRHQMAGASVFLQASLTDTDGWMEGSSVSLAEALASGLPAVVSNSGGNPDLVVDGKNGFLFPEGDAAKMAEGMIRLASDPDLRLRMGRAARVHVEQVANCETNVTRLYRLLESSARNGNSRQR